MPAQPNELVSAKGERSVQANTLEPGTYYLNPYVKDVRLIDCRSQRYNLTDIGFPTKDGFWVSLEAIIEFRVKPEQAAKTYILFNEEREGKTLAEQIIAKVILPNARAYTRLQGSNFSGKEFITSDTRGPFQANFQKTMKANCDKQGIEIIQALITAINPPDKIADPVRRGKSPCNRRINTKRKSSSKRRKRIWPCKRPWCSRRKKRWPLTRKWWSSRLRPRKSGSGAHRRQQAAGGRRTKAFGRSRPGRRDPGQREGRRQRDQLRQRGRSGGLAKSVAAFSGKGDEYARWTLFKKLAPRLPQYDDQYRQQPADVPFQDVRFQADDATPSTVPALPKIKKISPLPGKEAEREGQMPCPLKRGHGSPTPPTILLSIKFSYGEISMTRFKLNMASWLVLAFFFMVFVATIIYQGFNWTVNRIYVPAGKNLLLRYKVPLFLTWNNKYAERPLRTRRRNRRLGKNARSRTAFLLPDLV